MSYTGEYHNTLRHGQGTYAFPFSYFKYTGDWQMGRMHGHGTFLMKDGSSYEGEFQNGEIQGKGLKRWADGSTYSGHFCKGEMHGDGEYIAAGGERYDGQWECNQRHGLGELTFANQDVYKGEFQRHCLSGRGMMAYADGSQYKGEWSNNQFHGEGILKRNSGETYNGAWIAGKKHGVGTLSTSTGYFYSGTWNRDQAVDTPTQLFVKTVGQENVGANTHLSLDAPEVAAIERGDLVPSMTIFSIRVVDVSSEEQVTDDGHLISVTTQRGEVSTIEEGRMIRMILKNDQTNEKHDFYKIDPNYNLSVSKDPNGQNESKFAGYILVSTLEIETLRGGILLEGLRFPSNLQTGSYTFSFSDETKEIKSLKHTEYKFVVN